MLWKARYYVTMKWFMFKIEFMIFCANLAAHISELVQEELDACKRDFFQHSG